MRAPLSDEMLSGKLQQVKWVVEKWIDEIEGRQIPGIHLPDQTGEAMVDWLRQFCGEVTMASRTLESLAEIMAGMVDM